MKRAALLCMILALLLSGCGTGAVSSSMDKSVGESAPERIAEVSEQSQPVPPEPTESESEEDEPVVNNDWEFDKPENHGVDGATLNQLHEAAEAVEIRSIVTVRDGVIIDEYYKDEYDENSVIRIASCTKSFSGALIGIAIDRGIIPGVDAKLADYLPQLADADDPRWREITIEHLLTHTSGIDWNEWNGGTTFGEMRRSENWVDFILEQSMAAEPGAVFNYTTGGSHLLSVILQQAAGMTEFEFAKEHLFAPLGMDSVEWGADPQGISDGGNGIGMTTRDAAKFGQLFLNSGEWNGQQIISREWVEESTKVRVERSGQNGSYGYQWWMRPFGEGNYDTYFAMGHGGHYIFVVPELELVTVITARFSDTYDTFPYFADYILDACD